MLSPITSALVLVSVLLIATIILLLIIWSRYERVLADHDEMVRQARKQSVNQSRSTLKGQISEQMAPLLPGFRYLPADSRFLGNPVDYVVFHGYTHLRDADESPIELEIVLLDVKQGGSQLSAEQRAIGEAVEAGRIRFEVARVTSNGTIETKQWHPSRRRGVSSETSPADRDRGI